MTVRGVASSAVRGEFCGRIQRVIFVLFVHSPSQKCMAASATPTVTATAATTPADAVPYPYSFTATTPTSTVTSADHPVVPRLLHPRKGKSVVLYMHDKFLERQNDPVTAGNLPDGTPVSRQDMFSHKRNRKHMVRPGTVLKVTSWKDETKTRSHSFAGVLLGIFRRGLSTSFIIRNVINQTGVEVRYKLHSPMIKDIEIIKPAANIKSNAIIKSRHNKLYFLRRQPQLMNMIANAVKNRTAAEQGDKKQKQKKK